jgi:predicted histidine transporter YuiF (NhaC family)
MTPEIYSPYLVIAIGFLSAVTLNRGIYLYHKDKYEKIENTQDKIFHNYSGSGFLSNDNNKVLQKQVNDDRKKLSIQHFRVSLAGSILTIIVGNLLKNSIISSGLMLGGVINIIFSSVSSWNYLEEAEKFSVSAVALFCLIAYVVYKYKS